MALASAHALRRAGHSMSRRSVLHAAVCHLRALPVRLAAPTAGAPAGRGRGLATPSAASPAAAAETTAALPAEALLYDKTNTRVFPRITSAEPCSPYDHASSAAGFLVGVDAALPGYVLKNAVALGDAAHVVAQYEAARHAAGELARLTASEFATLLSWIGARRVHVNSPTAAVALARQMHADAMAVCPDDASVHAALITATAARGASDFALRFLRTTLAASSKTALLLPDGVETVAPLLTAALALLSQTGQTHALTALAAELNVDLAQDSPVAFAFLEHQMKAHCLSGCPQDAEAALEAARVDLRQLPASWYTVLAEGYARVGDVPQTRKYFNLAVADEPALASTPSAAASAIHSALFTAYASARSLSQAFELYVTMRRTGILPTAETVASMVVLQRSCATKNPVGRANRWYNKRPRFDQQTFDAADPAHLALMGAYIQHGETTGAYLLWNRLARTLMQVDLTPPPPELADLAVPTVQDMAIHRSPTLFNTDQTHCLATWLVPLVSTGMTLPALSELAAAAGGAFPSEGALHALYLQAWTQILSLSARPAAPAAHPALAEALATTTLELSTHAHIYWEAALADARIGAYAQLGDLDAVARELATAPAAAAASHAGTAALLQATAQARSGADGAAAALVALLSQITEATRVPSTFYDQAASALRADAAGLRALAEFAAARGFVPAPASAAKNLFDDAGLTATLERL